MAETSATTSSSPGGRPAATIGRKLALIFASIGVLFGLVSVVVYRSVNTLTDTAGKVEHTYQVLDRIDALRSSLKDAETGQRGYLVTGQDAYLAPYQQALTDLGTEQQQLRSLTADNPKQQKRLDDLAPLVDAKLAELQETIGLRRDKGFEAARTVVLTDKGKAVMDQIRAVAEAMSTEESSLLGVRAAAAASAKRTTQVTIVAGLVALLAGMAAAATLITRQTSRRVSRLRAAITSLAGGDLTSASGLTTGDEFGMMGRDLDHAVDSVQTMMAELAATVTELSTSAHQLAQLGGDLNSGADEASGKAIAASESASLINASVESVAAGAEQMTASIREIAGTSAQAAAVANESLEIASSTSRQISELGQSSTEISDVVRLITSIAEQTNLLALNATIEAARAGDAGKGFAVVASEVKDLAQETARATEDITRRIAAIQSSSEAAGVAVQRIQQVIGQINDYSNTIAAAVEQQSATTNEMTRSITEAAENSRLVRTSFAAVAQVTSTTADAAQASRRAADHLSALAGKLNSVVSRFRY
ncbi:Methyl-accepting chemotaxis aspartate transducer [Actinoplanes sp. SE50]|uniref:methyl-accepting chemotaxis protein n=1 Tax=unclassified Actinoplanes TaxID=2626549 RepID=UPI00023EC5A8|nr:MULTISPECIES: CHASE3 domain-containing protein [unclassified Actinoplanes]AEV83057.1 Methyl-accepting chemotaxis aspartate transducer [Actinoplanes sp. SE50/110]ATO81453.1 Methyl-accepting chemotaxis aspartate transducer [Actinoplanes sp. SE50]SLL98860.1 Methyl-accepting chemotaxis aspartate transducer [Actinoplanes sp. SE50/110]